MAHYFNRAQLHFADTRDEAGEGAVRHWMTLADKHGVREVALIADASNQEIDRLNGRAQHLRSQRGELLEQAKRTVYTDAPALTVPEVADELGVSRPTVRSWIAKGLLDVVADTSPRCVKFASVQELKERLAGLRALAKDQRRFSQLLREAADRRALAQPGAREGLQDALAGDTVDL